MSLVARMGWKAAWSTHLQDSALLVQQPLTAGQAQRPGRFFGGMNAAIRMPT